MMKVGEIVAKASNQEFFLKESDCIWAMVTIFLLILLVKFLKNRKRSRLIDEIPGPKTIPVFGNLLKFALPPHGK